ncbi:modular serine protease-like isoform X2 [Agrilus planipennis]|uniref:Modular serine protease-like isoform X2 n=1 Tax=Agrilus planipennis TaxID=224129 RepID=A0A1W4WW20_AGRPL|nr:modular serine protease-like isoform X2 [Agrilus planipennis]
MRVFTSLAKDKENFVCVNGDIIELENVCDGIKHCVDGSDETMKLCFHIICPPSMTRCFYGACIGKEKLCDGKSDCVDDSDENNCSGKLHICGMNEFKCTSGECISSENICDGVSHCLDKSDENEVLCEDDLCPDDAFHCNHGGCVHMDALCNGFKDCVDGSDETEIVCKMKNCGKNCDKVKENISCPPVFSERLNIICESKEGPKQGLVPCNKPASVGTIAKYGCKPFYVPAGSSQENNKQMVCQMDGKWSREALKCEPECGTRKPEATALIINGSVSKIGRWPWHATLYILEGGDWTYSCGGSLIHERAVLTAGHCAWQMEPHTIKVALGKYFSDYKMKQDFTVFAEIDKIITQPLYQDLNGNFGSDIAILILKVAIQYSDFIKPICLDWNLYDITEHLTENSIGTVVGMGITEDDKFSLQLREVKIPVVSAKKCINVQSRDFKKFITYTSFCAGWNNG